MKISLAFDVPTTDALQIKTARAIALKSFEQCTVLGRTQAKESIIVAATLAMAGKMMVETAREMGSERVQN